mmetsp:Transcript_12882/g.25172  ORF Transcript_12882/g.25172 Transcript_12882/m.25172 type:complete len:270 (-) Transcript_12882:284-1093(-)
MHESTQRRATKQSGQMEGQRGTGRGCRLRFAQILRPSFRPKPLPPAHHLPGAVHSFIRSRTQAFLHDCVSCTNLFILSTGHAQTECCRQRRQIVQGEANQVKEPESRSVLPSGSSHLAQKASPAAACKESCLPPSLHPSPSFFPPNRGRTWVSRKTRGNEEQTSSEEHTQLSSDRKMEWTARINHEDVRQLSAPLSLNRSPQRHENTPTKRREKEAKGENRRLLWSTCSVCPFQSTSLFSSLTFPHGLLPTQHSCITATGSNGKGSLVL